MADKLLLSVREVGEALGGISRAKVYQLIKTHELTTVHIGKRAFVRVEDLQAYVRGLKRTSRKSERLRRQHLALVEKTGT